MRNVCDFRDEDGPDQTLSCYLASNPSYFIIITPRRQESRRMNLAVPAGLDPT